MSGKDTWSHVEAGIRCWERVVWRLLTCIYTNYIVLYSGVSEGKQGLTCADHQMQQGICRHLLFAATIYMYKSMFTSTLH